jgi:7-cyano-7-deazaguanine synthase in queuosine biosynthesis
LFVDCGQPYLEKELSVIDQFYSSYGLVKVKADLVDPLLDNVPTPNKPEIYGRNLLATFYGALLGDEVWVAALSTEMGPTAVPDKQPKFFDLTSQLFSHIMQSKRPTVRVCTPFANMTKTDVVRMGLDMGITRGALTLTSSCYDPVKHNCGVCNTCFKRWIAMVNNGIEEHYDRHPFLYNQYARDITVAMYKQRLDDPYFLNTGARFSSARMQEMEKAFNTDHRVREVAMRLRKEVEDQANV